MFKVIISILYFILIILNNNLRKYLFGRNIFISVPLIIIVEYYFFKNNYDD